MPEEILKKWGQLRKVPAILDRWEAEVPERIQRIEQVVDRMKAAQAGTDDPRAAAMIRRRIRTHAGRLNKMKQSRARLGREKQRFGSGIQRIREAGEVLEGALGDEGLGFIPLIVAGVTGVTAFGGWLWKSLSESKVAEQEAENEARKIEMVAAGQLPADTLEEKSPVRDLGKVLKWGGILAGLAVAYKFLKK